jgi:CO/xanthine dehydrogenase Mo-binding subunit
MTRKAGDQTPYTTYSLDECIRRGAEAFQWKTRWKPQPGSDRGPIKRGAGVSFMAFRAGLGRSSAVVRVDAKGKYSVHVGVTDVGGGAKTTMGLIAAEELGVPLSQLEVVWGRYRSLPCSVRRIREPHDHHDRLRRRGGRAGFEEADRGEGLPKETRC